MIDKKSRYATLEDVDATFADRIQAASDLIRDDLNRSGIETIERRKGTRYITLYPFTQSIGAAPEAEADPQPEDAVVAITIRPAAIAPSHGLTVKIVGKHARARRWQVVTRHNLTRAIDSIDSIIHQIDHDLGYEKYLKRRDEETKRQLANLAADYPKAARMKLTGDIIAHNLSVNLADFVENTSEGDQVARYADLNITVENGEAEIDLKIKIPTLAVENREILYALVEGLLDGAKISQNDAIGYK